MKGARQASLSLLLGAASCLPQATFADSLERAYFLQIAAYSSPKEANLILNKVKSQNKVPGRVLRLSVSGRTFYSVQVGPYPTYNAAKGQSNKGALLHKGFIRSYVQQSTPIIERHLPSPKPHHLPQSHAAAPKPHPLPQLQSTSIPIVEPQTPQIIRLPLVEKTPSLWEKFSYNPRTLGDGTLSQNTNFFAGDILLPFLGNNDWIGFVDGAGKYGEDKAWFGSIGSGWRGVNDEHLWGAYIFGDRNVSRNRRNFWVVNPGLEWMTTRVDTHLNAYIPVSPKNQILSTVTGQSLGIPNSLSFQNHTLFESLYNIMDTTGPGLDAEIGFRANAQYPVRAFIGGYFFNMAEGSKITGIEGGVEYPLNERISIRVHDAYDRVQGNTFMGTLRIVFGQNQRPVYPDIHNRLLDPFQRHLGAYQTGAGVPINNVLVKDSVPLVTDNIWFFNPGGSIFNLANGFSNCTYENPCGEFSQDALNGINSLAVNAKLFIDTGVYDNPLPGTGFSMYSGQSAYGRTQYFQLAAFGNNRPLLNDTFILPGNNRLEHLHINGQTITANGVRAGVSITGATGPVVLNNDLIEVSANNGPEIRAVDIRNSPRVLINNSEINASMYNNLSQVTALNSNSPTLVVGTTLNVISVAGSGATGVFTNKNMALIGDTINLSTSGGSTNSIRGIDQEGGILNVYNSSINMLIENGTYQIMDGIRVTDNVGTYANANISNTQINISANTISTLRGIVGISVEVDKSLVVFENSQLLINGNDINGGVIGIINAVTNDGFQIDNSLISISINQPYFDVTGLTGLASVNNSVIAARTTNEVQSLVTRGISGTGKYVSTFNTIILASANTPGSAEPVQSQFTINNLGNTICIKVQNEVRTVTTC